MVGFFTAIDIRVLDNERQARLYRVNLPALLSDLLLNLCDSCFRGRALQFKLIALEYFSLWIPVINVIFVGHAWRFALV